MATTADDGTNGPKRRPAPPPKSDAPPLHASVRFTEPKVPRLDGATMLIALTGWMDGGHVSTGTVRHLMEGRTLREIAHLEPGGFYIDNFPGSMEVSALFRPEVKYEGGLVTRFDLPANVIRADVDAKMLFFVGREPNLDWVGFAEAMFGIAREFGVTRMIFMGSFGGTVPHTREPRLFGSVSSKDLLPLLERFGLKASDYEGPASFASYLLYLAPQHDIEMVSIAAEIPGYLQGLNPLSIEAVTRRLAAMLDMEVDLESLRHASTEWELKVTEAVQEDEELAQRIRKLEEAYDNELISEDDE